MAVKNRVLSVTLAVLALLSIATVAFTANVKGASNSSIVYFDNSFGWENVYLYTYGTKENKAWPGEKMTLEANGMYSYTMDSTFKSQSIIVNNGLDKKKDDGAEQFPENAGLAIKAGECKLLTSLQWIDYGKPDDSPYGFAYTAAGTSTTNDTMSVKIGLKNAVKGTYAIDDGTPIEYTGETTISVGQGKIANSKVKLTLTATDNFDNTNTTNIEYKKSFTEVKTTFSSPSDGHTTEPMGGYYGTNPNMQLGKEKTISIDGNFSDWDTSMIIAQGVANDDPRVYMPSSMHEQPWDDYALYAAWDNDNLYFMWEWVNTTYIVSPGDNFAASDEARPYRNSIPIFLALSVDPEKSGSGQATETKKGGGKVTYPHVWSDGKDGGMTYSTNVDTIVAFDTNNSNGGSAIIKLDEDGYFNYDTSIKIGVTSYEKQDNQNGFKIKYGKGTVSDSIIGINAPKGSRTMGDSYDAGSNWVDFFDLGYKETYGYLYEVAIPLANLGIDKTYIEENGIGAMKISTYGTSGMNSLPHDPSMLDNSDAAYSYDPSTSHEKEDVDNITVPLARVGALLKDTEIHQAPLQVNFGADKAAVQPAGANIALSAQAFSGTAPYTYKFTVNGNVIQNSAADTVNWKPETKGTYSIGVTVTDADGQEAVVTKTYTVGQAIAETDPSVTQPTASTEESGGTEPVIPTGPSDTNPTDPSSTEPTGPVTVSKLGDINLDGDVSIKDVTVLQQYLADIVTLNQQQLANAKVLKDGEISIKTATVIQRYLADLITKFPVEE